MLGNCWVIAGGWNVADVGMWCERRSFVNPFSAQFWSLCCEVEVEEGYFRRYEGLAYVACSIVRGR